MIGIDTNILVRYFTNDDLVESKKAAELITSYSNIEASMFINNIVLCELIWVLERGYKYQKAQIVVLLKELLLTIEFFFENHEILWLSCLDYEKYPADFADILIGKLNNKSGCVKNFTFDKTAASALNFELLE